MKALAKLQLPFKIVINGNVITVWDRVVVQGNDYYQCLVNKSVYLQLITEDELKDLLDKADD